jgi:hypothetical protein
MEGAAGLAASTAEEISNAGLSRLADHLASAPLQLGHILLPPLHRSGTRISLLIRRMVCSNTSNEVIAFLAALLSAIAISAQVDAVGTAKVIDGDTIVIVGEHVLCKALTRQR